METENGRNYVSNARDHKLICLLFSQDNKIKTVIDITQKFTFDLEMMIFKKNPPESVSRLPYKPAPQSVFFPVITRKRVLFQDRKKIIETNFQDKLSRYYEKTSFLIST